MRVLIVWIVATTLIFMVSVSWYVSQPLVIGVARGMNSYITNANARNIATAVEYVSYAWGPLMIVFVLLWAIISSQARDVESEIYG